MMKPSLALTCAIGAAWPSQVLAEEAPPPGDVQIFADIEYGWVTLELGTAATLFAAATHERFTQRSALIGGLATVTGMIGAGVLAHRLDAPISGANAMQGALWGGGTLALTGALLDHSDRRLRFRGTALVLGLAGAVGGAWVGARRVPTDSMSMAWTYAPMTGAAAGVLVGGLWEFASPSHRSYRIPLVVAVGAGLGLGAGWLMAERHVGALYPEPVRGVAARPFLLSYGGAF